MLTKTSLFLCQPCRYEDICPSTHNMDVPHVKREDLQLISISDDGYLTMMNENGDLREDLKVPDGELGDQLRNDFDNGKDLLVSYTVARFCSYYLFCFYAFSAPFSRRAEKSVLSRLRPILLWTNKQIMCRCKFLLHLHLKQIYSKMLL